MPTETRPWHLRRGFAFPELHRRFSELSSSLAIRNDGKQRDASGYFAAVSRFFAFSQRPSEHAARLQSFLFPLRAELAPDRRRGFLSLTSIEHGRQRIGKRGPGSFSAVL